MNVSASTRLSATWPRDCGRWAPTGAAKRLRQEKKEKASFYAPPQPPSPHPNPTRGSALPGEFGYWRKRSMLNALLPAAVPRPAPQRVRAALQNGCATDKGREDIWHHRTLRPEVLEGRSGGKSCWALGSPPPFAGCVPCSWSTSSGKR